MGLLPLLNRPQRAPLSLLPGQSKKTAVHEPGNRLSPNTETVNILTFELPSLQNCEKHISVVYKAPSIQYSITAA